MSRYSNSDADPFDLQAFRSQLMDKIMPIAKQQYISSPKPRQLQMDQSVKPPSFESITTKLRDFSIQRVQKTHQEESPQKHVGMKKKITSTLGDSNTKLQSPYFIQSKVKVGNFSPLKQQNSVFEQQRSNFSTASISSPETFRWAKTTPGKNNSSSTRSMQQGSSNRLRDLTDQISLNDIVSFRSKIDSSNVNTSKLTATYVTELVKLAQSITNALKSEQQSRKRFL